MKNTKKKWSRPISDVKHLIFKERSLFGQYSDSFFNFHCTSYARPKHACVNKVLKIFAYWELCFERLFFTITTKIDIAEPESQFMRGSNLLRHFQISYIKKTNYLSLRPLICACKERYGKKKKYLSPHPCFHFLEWRVRNA